jgi:FkbM family methyltransferase
MALGQKIIEIIENRRKSKLLNSKGPIGEFYKTGGNSKLYDVLMDSNDLIIDIGGYKGEWTANMLIKYGCKSIIYEPIPNFANICKDKFRFNKNVEVINAAVGGSTRKTFFSFADNGTSEFVNNTDDKIEADVLDIAEILDMHKSEIGCIKMNIEGGEYELLERLIESNKIKRIKSLLIQFHTQPENFESRYIEIQNKLKLTHRQKFSHYMVWESWEIKD